MTRGRFSPLFVASALTLTIAVILGGAGSSYPLAAALVETAGLVLLWFGSATGRFLQPVRGVRVVRVLQGIAVGIIMVPLLQLVPLPPALWTVLPGRALAVAVMEGAGVARGWRPLSLDPGMTIDAALETLPGLALFAASLRLCARDQVRLVRLVILAALGSALLAGLQRASGGTDWVTPFAGGHRGSGTGLFVNRNHLATFLLMAMPLTAADGAFPPRARGRYGSLLTLLVLAAGVVTTTSRMGLALVLPMISVALILLFRHRMSRGRIVGAAVALCVVAGIAYRSSAVQVVFARLRAGPDGRTEFWATVWRGIGDYWPVGSGIGSFTRVYPVVEPLAGIATWSVDDAHDDYLQLVLEAGAPAIVLMVCFGIAMAAIAWRLLRTRSRDPSVTIGLGALAGIAVVLVHSVVDYPLRMMTVSAVFGLLCGIAASAAGRVARSPRM